MKSRTSRVFLRLNYVRFWFALFVVFAFLLQNVSVAFSEPPNAAPPGQSNNDNQRSQQHRKGKLLVKFQHSKSPQEIEEFLQSFNARRGKNALVPQLGLYEVSLPSLPEGTDEHAYKRAFKDDPRNVVELVELDKIYEPVITPNDPEYQSQWHLQRISLPGAWDVTTGSTSLKIAILDSGVNGSHPDLAGKLVPGWNTFNNSNDTSDVNGHGTRVAGVVAAATNNGIGMAGVTWGPKIMPIRIASSDGRAYGSTIIAGIVWAADNGAKVANISFSNMANDPLIDAAAHYMQLKGGLVVAAAGLNWGATDTDDPFILNVNATDYIDALASFCGNGNFVDVAAPGMNILTTDWTGGYISLAGLSLATPIVSGVAALVMTANPNLTPFQVSETIKRSALDLGPPGFDPGYGHGRINAQAAVDLAVSGGPVFSDKQLPTVTITSPIGGNVSGPDIPIQVSASDNVSLLSVNLMIDGVIIDTDMAAPYEFRWDSKATPNGPHIIQVETIDTSWNSATAQTQVTVNNVSESIPPQPNFWCPQAGEIFSATREILTYAGEPAAIHVTTDNLSSLAEVPVRDGPYGARFFLNTTPLTNGTHTLRIDGIDLWGNSAYKEVPFSVRNMGSDLIPPPLPLPNSPNSVTTNDNTPTFSWNEVSDPSGIQSYRLQIFSDPLDLTSPKVDVSGITTTSYTVTGPLAEGGYLWRVSATDGAGNVDNCGSVAYFTIDASATPQVPTPTSPTNGASLNNAYVNFSWSGLERRYKLEVADNSSFIAPAQYEVVGTTTYGPVSVFPGTVYWRVKAINENGVESAFSTARSFTLNISGDVTGPPGSTLLSPVNGSRLRGQYKFANYRAIALDWSDVSDPSGVAYRVQIDNNSDFASPEVDYNFAFESRIPELMLNIADGTYWWRVQSTDGAYNLGSWSTSWSFILDNSAPASPALQLPAANAMVTTGTPVLDWADASDPAGVRYRIEISDVNFVPEIFKYNLTSSTFTPTTSLPPGLHYWRVAADDALGNLGVMGPRRSFRVAGDNVLPSAPIPISPSNGSNTPLTSLTFDWNNVMDASGVTYRLQVDYNGTSFATPEVDVQSLSNSLNTVSNLPNGTHSWRVMAVDGAGNQGPWSSVMSLTIGQGEAPVISSSSPLNLFVDPLEDRNPTTGAQLGITDVTITFSTPVTNTSGTALTLANFERRYFRGGIEVSAANADLANGGAAPTVALVSGSGAGPYLIRFAPRIPLAAWTQIKAINVISSTGTPISATENRVILGNLPMDITQDGRVFGDDISRWLAINSNSYNPAPLSKLQLLDQRRNGTIAGEDINRATQLINGISTFRAWSGFDLGARP